MAPVAMMTWVIVLDGDRTWTVLVVVWFLAEMDVLGRRGVEVGSVVLLGIGLVVALSSEREIGREGESVVKADTQWATVPVAVYARG